MFDSQHCVHCGLCLTTCPTYQETGLESESPRGRVYLLQEIAQDSRALDALSYRHLDDCLDCRACEEVCPAHVPLGHMVEEFRASAAASPYRATSGPERALTRFLGSPGGLRWFQRLARWSQASWAERLLKKWPQLVPPEALKLKAGLPRKLPHRLSRDDLTKLSRSADGGERAMLFLGCIMDSVYAQTNLHTKDLLQKAGVEVVVPFDQRCCGALHLHAGEPEVARRWAQDNIRAFEDSGAGALIVNAAGCGALLKEYATLFSEDDPWFERARRFQQAVRDVSEYLVDHPLPALPQGDVTVTVHDACHLAHAQGIRSAPRELLRRSGYRVVEMEDADRCCGSAGIYNLTHPVMAQKLQERKVADIPAEADCLATGNPGCLLQIQAGVNAQSVDVEVVHTVDLLWRAYHESKGEHNGRAMD